MQFIPPEFAQHSLVIQTLNSEWNKQAKYMKTAMFITIQDKYKIILEYFAMCTYSMHKIKTNTWVSFNF